MHKSLSCLSLVMILLALAGCKDVDVRLINEIKTFEPQWTTLGEEIAVNEKYLSTMEKEVTEFSQEVSPVLDQVEDSLKDQQFERWKAVIARTTEVMDSVKTAMASVKESFSEKVERYNEWQKPVLNGEADVAIARTELNEFKREHQKLEEQVMDGRELLVKQAEKFNQAASGLAERTEVYSNFDIHFQ